MSRGSSPMTGAAFGLLSLLLAAGALHAQDTNSVGNPQLKDFQLPGTQTLPPPLPQEQPAPPANSATPSPDVRSPAPASAPPPPPAEGTPRAVEPPPAPQPRAAPRPSARTESPVVAPAPEVRPQAPAPTELEQAPPAAPPAAPKTEWQPPVTSDAGADRSFPWLYVGLGALLALLATLGLLALKRSRATAAERSEAEAIAAQEGAAPDEPPLADPLFARRAPAEAGPSAAPAPVPATAAPPAPAAPTGLVGVSMRPRIELEFKANRAAATLTEAVVQYELVVRNVGNSPASGVRLQAFMTNAGPQQDQEIGDFFSQSTMKDEPVAIVSLAPGAHANVRSSLTLPRDQLREITIQGRRLFIPIVAFNVYYEWGEGRSGQTSMSYVVGREAPTPQDKMGAFRLDLGPRLYRSVSQRQSNLAKVL